MAFIDRVVQYPNRVTLTAVSGETDTYDMERAEGTVTEEGTPLNAANLNNEIQSMIADAIQGITIDNNGNVSYRNMQSGKVLVKPSSARATTTVNVTFPQAFTKVPNVVVSSNGASPSTTSVSAGAITTTGFTLYFYRTTQTNTYVSWIAHVD